MKKISSHKSSTTLTDIDIAAMGRLARTVLESLDYQVSESDWDKVAKRARHIDYGLSAEDEFSSIAAWLGRCKLIHKLDQNIVASLGKDHAGQVPDLLIIVEHNGVEQCFLVEVKTSSDFTIQLKDAYLEKLKLYADRLNLPLLIAFKSRQVGFWCLFDPFACSHSDRKGSWSFEKLFPNCLMGALLGDFHVRMMTGSGLRIDFKPDGPRKKEKTGGFTQHGVISSVRWHDAKGINAHPPVGIVAALLSNCDYSTSITEGLIRQEWLASDSIIQAQKILRATVSFSVKSGDRIRWKKVASDLDNILMCKNLEKDISDYFGSFSQHIFHVFPRITPVWFPNQWRSSEPDKSMPREEK